MSEQVMGAARSLDSVRKFALFARIACVVYMLACLGPGVILVVLRFGFGVAGIRQSAFMIALFGAVAFGTVVTSSLGYLAAVLLARDPVVYAWASAIAFGVAGSAALFGFVSSVLAASALPYVASLLPVLVVWFFEWPRVDAWMDWASRPRKSATISAAQ